jgi:excisionase family DNA binding protein
MTRHQHQRTTQPPDRQDTHVGDRPGDLGAGRLAYSVKEAAEATGLSRDLLYDEMRAGRLAYLKVGRRRVITRQQLQAFLARPPQQ